MKQKELVYKEYLQRENEWSRAPYTPELAFYAAVQAGDLTTVEELCREPFHTRKGLGQLSPDPLRNLKYHFAITASIVARYCIEGGMEHTTAYNLSDYYIQTADSLTSVEALSDLHGKMRRDYTLQMKNLRTHAVYSKQVITCIRYIYDHLHTRITLQQLATVTQSSPSYLSRLFHKETGSTVQQYIRQKKLETVCNMLTYSSFSIAEISNILAFPSQSYLTECFRNTYGITPLQHRKYSQQQLLIHPDPDTSVKSGKPRK